MSCSNLTKSAAFTALGSGAVALARVGAGGGRLGQARAGGQGSAFAGGSTPCARAGGS